MTQKKGLSQILWLIVAASVLMIAALSLVFMLQGGLEGLVDFGGQADASTCESQAQSICQSEPDGSVQDAPSSCITEDADNERHTIDGVNEAGFSINPEEQTITC